MSGSKIGRERQNCKEVIQASSQTRIEFHCIIHQKALCCQISLLNTVRTLLFQQRTTFDAMIRPTVHYRTFWNELKQSTTLVVVRRWNGWAQVQSWRDFFPLRSEINIFVTKKSKTVPKLGDDKWILHSTFLVDIMTYFNGLYVKFHGRGKLQSDMFSIVKAFEMKPKLLHTNINKQDYDNLLFKKMLKIFRQTI